MAKRFHELKLPEGYFTHILIDEASQMLECEALIPLGLAGPSTRVVLAGDHMQMGPKLFSVDDHQRSDYTLLNRLFHYYHGHDSDVAQKSRILFNENYRSTKEIVEFVSTHFYVGRGDVIKCGKTVPAGPKDCSLKFHHVRGDCQLNTHSMSWFNNAEVNKVVEVLEDILRRWPCTWGPKNPSSICVLSEGWQVNVRFHLLGECCKQCSTIVILRLYSFFIILYEFWDPTPSTVFLLDSIPLLKCSHWRGIAHYHSHF